MSDPPACLVLTTGHHPDDARLHRHLHALREAGYAAELVARGHGRHPLARLLLAPFLSLSILTHRRPRVVILPDPELHVLGVLVARALGVRAVIDLHEDYRAVAADRAWIPGPLRGAAGRVAGWNTGLARRLASAVMVATPHLAEPGDLVVRNLPDPASFPPDPPPAASRPALVYVGDISRSRGAHEMIELLSFVPDVRLELIGPVTPRLAAELRRRADRLGCSDRLDLIGRLPYPNAWGRALGALAGLSLLHATPAYRDAVPSKLWEYLAAGLPVIATDLPGQRIFLEERRAGVAVADPAEAAEHLHRWLQDPEIPRKLGQAGRRFFLEEAERSTDREHLLRAVGD